MTTRRSEIDSITKQYVTFASHPDNVTVLQKLTVVYIIQVTAGSSSDYHLLRYLLFYFCKSSLPGVVNCVQFLYPYLLI